MNSTDILVSKRYAKAYASLEGDGLALYTQLSVAYQGIKGVEGLFNPTISKEKKKGFVEQAFKGDKSIVLFFNLLIDAKRLNLLSQIVVETKKIVQQKLGIKEVSITSAYQMSDAQKASVKNSIQKFFGSKDIDATFREDKTLLGGLVIKNEDITIDGSILGGLTQLKNVLR